MTKKAFIYLFILLALLGWAFVADAYVLTSQTTGNQVSNEESEDSLSWYQELGTGFSGSVTAITFKLGFKGSAISDGDKFNFTLIGYSSDVYSGSLYSEDTQDFTIVDETDYADNGAHYITLFFDDPVEVESTDYLVIGYEDGTGNPQALVYGSSVDGAGAYDDITSYVVGGLSSGGEPCSGITGNPLYVCGDLETAYYVVDADSSPAGVNTRVIQSNSPNNGATTGSTNVTFDFDYYYGEDRPDITLAGVEIQDLTDNYSYSPIEETILASGESSYVVARTLEQGHLHLWRPYLRATTSINTIYGDWQSFDVVTASASSTQYIDPETGLPIVSTSTTFFDFINVPNLLRTKAPFAYMYEISDIITDFDTVTATNTPAFTLDTDFASTTLPGLGDIELFSVDTVTELIPSGMLTIMRALMVATVYISLAFVLFREIRTMFV